MLYIIIHIHLQFRMSIRYMNLFYRTKNLNLVHKSLLHFLFVASFLPCLAVRGKAKDVTLDTGMHL